MNRTLASGVASLGAANGLALLAAAASTALFAGWLDAAAFAHWAMAIALARAGVLLLDGGLKTALVRRSTLPGQATLRQLGAVSAALATLLTVAIAAVALTLWAGGRLPAQNAALLAAIPAAYLLTYPPLFGALARLERAHAFAVIGRAEGMSVLLEFTLPVALMAAGCPWWLSFVAPTAAARLLRSAWMVNAAGRLADAGVAETDVVGEPLLRPAQLLREGLGVQAVAGLSMLRDQMHLWLLAPWFGTHWAASYALALTACALVSQAMVQTASRVSMPLLRTADAAARWSQVLAQTRLLAMCTLPPLALLPAWLAHADAAWWDGRWTAAAVLVPWLAARMVAGVATTTLGAWLMVAQSPGTSARAHAAWTAVEVASAVLALQAFGVVGMAVAAMLSPWIGALLFIAAAAPGRPLWPRAAAVAAALLLRPSLWAALALAAWVRAEPSALLVATLALPLAWLAEPTVRRFIDTPRSCRNLAAHPLPAIAAVGGEPPPESLGGRSEGGLAVRGEKVGM